MRNATGGHSHNCASMLMGQRGVSDVTEKQYMETLLMEQATAAPRTALRTARRSGKVKGISKTQARWLKKKILRRFFTSKVLGDAVRAIEPHTEIPAVRSTGYFCYHLAERQAGKPVLALVATTRELQRRWCEGSRAGLPAHVDGGYKFNMCGWRPA